MLNQGNNEWNFENDSKFTGNNTRIIVGAAESAISQSESESDEQ